MFLMLGGLPGSGRKHLARQIAAESDFFYYDMNIRKQKRFKWSKDGVSEQVIHPSSDSARLSLYEKVLKDLPLIAKMYRNVVIDDSFHRMIPRGFFITEASRYFDRCVFIWIECEDSDIEANLSPLLRNGTIHSLEDGFKRRERAQRSFEAFDRELVRYRYRRDARAAKEVLGIITALDK
jgi:hypothetical protein